MRAFAASAVHGEGELNERDDDIDDLHELQRLLAEGAVLAEPELQAWLERLPPAQQRYRAQLRAMLDRTRVPGQTQFDSAQTTRSVDALGPLALLAEGTRIGPYRLERELGHGGMGTVWVARRADGTLDRAVALKLPIYSIYSRGFAERFARERDILASLSHPNIAPLFDAGVAENGQPYLAMEIVDGVPIDDYCDTQRLGIAQRVALFAQALGAVQHAHRNLVLHRDLKPGNMLVTPEGQVKLLDFGIAKLMTDGTARETQLTALEGRALTPDYASPEQVVGAPLTTASDVYSLGIVLYELLCGARPYRLRSDSRGALDDAILHAEPPRPSQQVREAAAAARGTTAKRLAVQLRGDLDTIVLKALKKLPAERYDTVHDFAEDLRRWQQSEPVLAQPDSRWYQLRKFIGRNRLAVGAGAGVTLALIVGLGAALWQAHEAKQQQARAEAARSFLLSLLIDANPNMGTAGDARVSDLMKVAAQRVARDFAGDPGMAVQMYEAIAESLWNRGMVADAEKVARQAIVLGGKALAANDLRLLNAQQMLCEILVSTGRDTEAQAIFDQALPLLRAAGPVGVPILAAMLNNQSLSAYNQGRVELSLRSGREALALAQQALGEDKILTMTVATGLSNRLAVTGHGQEALQVAQKALDAAQRQFAAQGPHPMIVQLEEVKADALVRLGRPADAIPLLRQALHERGALEPGETMDLAYTLSSLGHAFLASGQPAEAVPLYTRALAIFDRNAEGSANGIRLRQRLAFAALDMGQPAQALAGFDDVLARWRGSGLTEDDPRLSRARVGHAQALMALGRDAEAQAELSAVSGVKMIAADRQLWQATQLRLQRRRGHSSAAAVQAAEWAGNAEVAAPSLESAAVLSEAGLVLQAAGQGARAIALLRKARALYLRLQVQVSAGVVREVDTALAHA